MHNTINLTIEFLNKGKLISRILQFSVIVIFCSCSSKEIAKSDANDNLTDSLTNNNKSISGFEEGQSIEGDFDGDGVKERATTWIAKRDSSGGCADSCTCFVVFSSEKFQRINLGKDIVGSHMINQGDLNEKRGDEFTIVPFGETGEWATCITYTYRGTNWEELINRFPVFGIEGDYINKDSSKAGFVIIDDFSTNEKSVTGPVKKSIQLKR